MNARIRDESPRGRTRPSFWVAGMLVGVVAGSLPAPGCAVVCEEYVECSARAGLRYVQCGEEHHEFNDGTSLTSAAAAGEYCYCSAVDVPCDDGGTATFCNGSHAGGSAYAIVGPEKSLRELDEAAAECKGFDSCEVVTTGCTAPLWYLECDDGGTSKFIGLTGTETTSRASALATCVGTESSGDSTTDEDNGYCTELLACDELEDCYDSNACIDDWGGCWTYPQCSAYDSESECDSDPACTWDAY